MTPDSIVCGVAIANVSPGDVLGGALVRYVVHFHVNAEIDICRILYLGLTPDYPVFFRGKWQRASNIVKPRKTLVKTAYNLVLNGKHTLRHDTDIEIVTLAHGFQDPERAHPYFGTHRCLTDILKVQDRGVAVLTETMWLKDAKEIQQDAEYVI